MSDANLRELERRWRETRSVEDEASWLLERTRVGHLDKDSVSLAAACGHQACQLLHRPTRGNISRKDADEWLEDLGRHGREVLERFCIAMSRSALPVWVRRFRESLRPGLLEGFGTLSGYEIDSSRPWETFGALPLRAVDRMERGLLTPGSESRKSLERPAPLGLCEAGTLRTPGETAASCAAVAIEYSNSAVFRASDDHMVGMAGVVYANALQALELDGLREAEKALVVQVESELVPWALGYRDPVRERVEARQREAAGE